jgi:ATP synthase protein I
VPRLTVKKEAYQIIYWQLILIMGLALVLFILQGIQSGVSALLGGLAYWLPTLLFVWRVFARTTARAAKQFLLMFVAGEGVKLLLSAVLFVLVIKYVPVKLSSVLIGFIGAVVSFWIASVFCLVKDEGATQ